MKELLKKFFNGECYNAYEYFGAHPYKNGYIFRVFAPNALEVQVVGDFNAWNGQNHIMNKIDNRGIYELYVEEVNSDYQVYRYNILTRSHQYIMKSDPYAFYGEMRPNTASKTFDLSSYKFSDEKWMNKRSKGEHAPINIYEIHLGSFLRNLDGTWMSYEQVAPLLVKYLKKHHFTHVEILPLMEHPFDGSWGYQCSQYFSITSRYGNPNQLKYLIDLLHKNNIGVIIDFVPVHFVKDATALGRFDGGHVYESRYLNKRSSQWGTYLFDYSKVEVMSFMLSCAYFYLKEYHFDGIRFDAISNMIYKDGNKDNGRQEPNINWMKKANNILSSHFPTAILIAEDSSDFPLVTKPTFEDGLGYDYKWDLGWMNDTLRYMKIDPYFRGHHINLINFSMYYFYNEKFLLPLSHDEVVHLKASLLNKMPGDYWQKFANYRSLMALMMVHPGKKLLFMGGEFAHYTEWNFKKELDWNLYKFPAHDSANRFVRDMIATYRREPALFSSDHKKEGFEWIESNNAEQSVFVFARYSEEFDEHLVVIFNATPVVYHDYAIGVPGKRGYVEIINSDYDIYGGSGQYNGISFHIFMIGLLPTPKKRR